MGHYARVENGKVVEVIKASSSFIENFPGNWIKTSYNTHAGVHFENKTPLRKNFAGVGYIYDPEKDAFIPPKVYDSWVLNEETCLWEPPIPMPEEGSYVWNEQTQSWDEKLS